MRVVREMSNDPTRRADQDSDRRVAEEEERHHGRLTGPCGFASNGCRETEQSRMSERRTKVSAAADEIAHETQR